MIKINLHGSKINFYLLGIILILSAALFYLVSWNDMRGRHEDSLISVSVSSGLSVKNDITRLVKKSFDHTKALAQDPELGDALKRRDLQRLGELANLYITNSSEVDIVAFFDTKGVILAANTCGHDGQPVEKARLDKVIEGNLQARPVISRCLTNNIESTALEFQTRCSFTPAFFDSSGLSVAMSSAVDDAAGYRVGVVSTRLNFERILKIVSENNTAAEKSLIYLVSAEGGYFSEAINSGKIKPPISKEKIRDWVKLLDSQRTDHLFFAEKDAYLNLVSMDMDATLEDGNMYILVKTSKE